MCRAESTARVHSVDVSLKSSPVHSRAAGIQRWVPTLGDERPILSTRFQRNISLSRGYGLSIPNLITLARILAVPVILWAITSGEMRVAFALFLAAGLSDLIDGYLAKRFGKIGRATCRERVETKGGHGRER